jgi:hypothetical protein
MNQVKPSSRQNTPAAAHQGATVALKNASAKKGASPGRGAPKGQCVCQRGKQRARSTANSAAQRRGYQYEAPSTAKVLLENAMVATDLRGTFPRFRVDTAPRLTRAEKST